MCNSLIDHLTKTSGNYGFTEKMLCCIYENSSSYSGGAQRNALLTRPEEAEKVSLKT